MAQKLVPEAKNGLSKFKNVGIIIIALTLLTICIILIILYKKTNR